MPKESVTRGVLLIVLAFLCVAIMSAFAKAATGIATGTLVFFQNAIALLLFAPWALDHGFSSLKTKHIWLHILRGLAGLLSQALMFAAVKKNAVDERRPADELCAAFYSADCLGVVEGKGGDGCVGEPLCWFPRDIAYLKTGRADARESCRFHRYQCGSLLGLRSCGGESTVARGARQAHSFLLFFDLFGCYCSFCFAVLESPHFKRVALSGRYRNLDGGQPMVDYSCISTCHGNEHRTLQLHGGHLLGIDWVGGMEERAYAAISFGSRAGHGGRGA